MDAALYALCEPERICTPALVVHADIARANTAACIREAGGAQRLWPHIKTHKMAEMLAMQMEMGIRRFKCATLPEASLAARMKAEAVLLAYPLIGPNAALFLELCRAYPDTRFYAIADSAAGAALLGAEACARGMTADVLADANPGMDRTGVAAGELRAFIALLRARPGLRFCGLHLYDGHIHDSDRAARAAHAAAAAEGVLALRRELHGEDWIVVAGGSPTMPCHVHEDVFLSPGTVFLWDQGYGSAFPDLPYTPAAAVLTRVVSHPAPGLFTLDCGVKAIACDSPGQRGVIVGLEEALPVMQNEEHWVWRMPAGREAERPAIGCVLSVIPAHICPTVALYEEAVAVSGGEILGLWRVAARVRDALASRPHRF